MLKDNSLSSDEQEFWGAVKELDFRERCRRELSEYCMAIDQQWQTPWHIKLLCAYLERLEQRKLNRLAVFMPPRHGKSDTCSIKFPAWYLGRNPQHQIIGASYSGSLAETFSGAARDTLMSPLSQRVFPCGLDREGTHRWRITGKENRRDSYVSAGVGGSMSGEGANLLIIDDPVKDAEEAASVVIRDKQWDWYKMVARTRLQPDAVVLLIMTRWHEDDLAGRMMAAMADSKADQWTILLLPAENKNGEGTPIPPEIESYEALCPEWFSPAYLANTRATVGPYVWSALYQQRPSPSAGTIFKRAWFHKFHRVATPEQARQQGYDLVVQSWDMAFKDKATSSKVVGQVWAQKGAQKSLLDEVRDTMDFPTTKAAVKTFTAKWPFTSFKWVEDKANGPAIIAELQTEIPGLVAVEPLGSKEARWSAASADPAAGNILLPDPSMEGFSWVHDWIEELCSVPSGLFDDRADAAAQAINKLRTIEPAILGYMKRQTTQAKKTLAPASPSGGTSPVDRLLDHLRSGT